MNTIKVLVVDDSVFMRQALTKILSTDKIEVVDIARNGAEAIEKVVKLKPDVVTMDIEMPIMNGIEALKEIMKVNPVPVIMLSTLTSEGADETIEALSIGAVDFLPKQGAFKELDTIKEILISKVLAIGSSPTLKIQMRNRNLLQKYAHNKSPNFQTPVFNTKVVGEQHITKNKQPGNVEIISIGISTGGPNTLKELLVNLPNNFNTPILIAQHMPPYFTNSMAKRLDSLTKLTIKEAEHDEKICAGTIYIAQGGRHMTVTSTKRISITDEPPNMLYKPSVDVLISSVADVYNIKAVGIIMTGMGHDGLEGIKKLVGVGGYSIAQDPETCVITGMPKTIIDAGLADEVQPLDKLSARLANICS